MSTTWIEDVLKCVEREPGAPGSAYICHAMAELEAIRKAAEELIGIWGHARHDIEAERVMEAIAKETP